MKQLGLTDKDHPWVGRDGVELRGLRKQASPVNFLHDLLDIRFADVQRRRGIPLEGPCPEDIVTDVRHMFGRQARSGKTTLLTKTVAYVHHRDRVLVGIEHGLQQGWDDDIDVSTVNEPLPDHVQDALDQHTGKSPPGGELPGKKKKRSKQRRSQEVCLKEGFGNAMALPDVGLLMKISFLAQDSPMWENPVDDNFRFDLGGISQRARMCVLDPNNTDVFLQQAKDDANDECGFACESDDDMD